MQGTNPLSSGKWVVLNRKDAQRRKEAPWKPCLWSGPIQGITLLFDNVLGVENLPLLMECLMGQEESTMQTGKVPWEASAQQVTIEFPSHLTLS